VAQTPKTPARRGRAKATIPSVKPEAEVAVTTPVEVAETATAPVVEPVAKPARKAPERKKPAAKSPVASKPAPKSAAASRAPGSVKKAPAAAPVPAEPKQATPAQAEAVAGALATPTGKAEVKREPGPAASAKAASGADGPALKPINLALQGGGAHGAFTWGVLDRLLEDGRIVVEGISGTSAGAMNAAVLATGLARGGNQGGREALDRYWRAVSKDGRTSPLQRTLLDKLMGNWSLNMNPAYVTVDMMSRFLSPYDFNPLNVNPLLDLINEHVDFDALQSCRHVHVFVSATNVHTGKVRVFARHELTAEAIMASACLPMMFQAVEIDGVPYWDGGFMGNPALFPFYNAVKTDDILLVQINPIIRRETPKTARDIQNRMNEITFNASLLAQLRAAEFVTRLLKHGKLKKKGSGIDGYRDLRLHRIDGAEKLIALDASTKMNAEWEFLLFLKAIGREAAEAFLEQHFDDIGVRSTLDVGEELRRG
jgi:NTE family protein